jgi:hypothetical protein
MSPNLHDDNNTPITHSPLVVICAGAPHRQCRAAEAEARRTRRPVLVAHTFPSSPARGAEVRLDLGPTGRPVSATARQRLEAAFELWSPCGWVMPGSFAILDPFRCEWTRIAPAALDVLLTDIGRLLILPAPALATADGGREPVTCMSCERQVATTRHIPNFGMTITVPCGCGSGGTVIVRSE